MIILLLVIFIILYILAELYWSYEAEIFFGIGTIMIFCVLIGFICTFPYNIESKLALYVEENARIEEKIKSTVQGYMNYEQETYNNLVKDADLTTLLISYPELNSNELVKMEIDTYKANSKEIKNYKEKQIDKNMLAWWLYFGG